MSNIGFRIYTKINRPPKDLVEAFTGLPVANIADSMNRFDCVDAHIKQMNSSHILGVAFTVRSRTADNLMFHKALDLAHPGDVIVVDVQGDTVNAVTGEIMVRYAAKRQIGGFLIDGAVRDIEAIRGLSFPVYARAATPKGPYKDGPGEINVPVSCGGVTIHPGDIIIGDADGVVVVRPDEVPGILEKTRVKLAEEKHILKQIEDGTFKRDWVDKRLVEKGCEIID
ncbi:methyltransferase [Alkalihalophilus pseudofirmus]|nr:methyltransferase [Alkalihalophilus pseudofirmus]